MKPLFFAVGLIFSLGPKAASCTNSSFLTEEVIIEQKEEGLSINDCDFNEEICFLSNLSRPEVKREVVAIEFGDQFKVTGEGYIRISLDNSFAEYGPTRLTSFLYCRSF